MKIQEVILEAVSGKISWLKAADIVGVSARTIRRWRARYEKTGYDGLLDRRKRIPSEKQVPLAQVREVLRLYRERYNGYNMRHFHETVTRDHGVKLSYNFVRSALQGALLVRKQKKRGGRHFVRRERKGCFGEMLHIDGSRHDWLSLGQNEKLTLIVVLDDARSQMLYAQLWEEESTEAILTALWEVVDLFGIPMALYNDRASWAFYTPKAGEKVSKTVLTQVGRALDQLGVEHIAAYTPQARGRSERVNRTLQGRLCNELRVQGITTKEGANEYLRQVYLPLHNHGFSKVARDPENLFVKAKGVHLREIFCMKESRVVSKDNVVRYQNICFQIEKQAARSTCAGWEVKVHGYLDETYAIYRGEKCLGMYDREGKKLNPDPASSSEKKGGLSLSTGAMDKAILGTNELTPGSWITQGVTHLPTPPATSI